MANPTLIELLDQAEEALAAGRIDDAKASLNEYSMRLWNGAEKGQPRDRNRNNLLSRQAWGAQWFFDSPRPEHCDKTIDYWRNYPTVKELKDGWKRYEKLQDCFRSKTSVLPDGTILTESVWIGLPEMPGKKPSRKKRPVVVLGPKTHGLNGYTPIVKSMSDTLRAMLSEPTPRWKERASLLLSVCEQLLSDSK